MRRFLLAAVLSLMTVPAFAADQTSVSQNENQFGVLEAAIDAAALVQSADQTNVEEDSARTLRTWICYSRDFYGQGYYGQHPARQRAARLAMYACSVYTRVGGCQFLGCEARW